MRETDAMTEEAEARDLAVLRCARCGDTFPSEDLPARCPSCGGDDVAPATEPFL